MVRGILIAWVILASLVSLGIGLFILRHDAVMGGIMMALALVLMGLGVALTSIVSPAQRHMKMKVTPRVSRHEDKTETRSRNRITADAVS